MMRKLLFFTLLASFASPVRAADPSVYCISSGKLIEMRDELAQQNPDMQPAYDELFALLIVNDESGSSDTAGCVTQADLAQICKNIWGDNTEACETFIYTIMTEPKQANFNPLQYSTVLYKTDFSDIDPDAFSQAFNKAVARRAKRNVPSKLQDMGPVFLAQAQEKHLNPFISAAISLYESGRGTSSLAQTKNNIAGLGGPGKWMSFPAVSDSIASQAQTLRRKVESGKKDLNSLACSGSYCATNTGPWFRDISSVTKELYRYYNAIIQGKK